ncbi:MAG: cobalamin biosynthesis protein CbiX [Planctomycetes bacterium]|nr:cobalamin biosynthesis protein CbiX [Planctomycetota bacterium]
MRALLLVDHGSKLPEANTLLETVAERIRAKGLFDLVIASHMEIAAPSIGVAFDSCVAAGAKDVTVAQYFLGPGRHSSRDIPRMAEEAAQRHPGVTWRVTEPLGLAEGVIEALLDRVREAGR